MLTCKRELSAMKKLFIICCIFVLTAILGSCDNEQEVETIEFSDYYYARNSIFELDSDSCYDAVFLGDSITDGSEWSELFPELRVSNRGIGGDTTYGIINRIDTILKMNSEKIFIMIGINDINIGTPIHDIEENYLIIINLLLTGGFKVYLQSTLYVSDTFNNSRTINEDVDKLNEFLLDLAIENNDLEFMDLNLELSNGGFLLMDYSFDGIHLNGTAYIIWRDLILEYLS